MTLKDELIKLGEDNPDLQDHLRVIIDHLVSHEDAEEVEEAPTEDEGEKAAPEEAEALEEPEPTPEPVVEEKKEENSVFNVPPAPKEDIFFNLSPASFRAFNTVILPQIQAKLDETSFDDLTKMMDEMAGLGRAKNPDLENALIVFKPISMSEKKFYAEIQEAFRNWLRPKMKSMAAPPAGAAPAGENVNVYFLPQ